MSMSPEAVVCNMSFTSPVTGAPPYSWSLVPSLDRTPHSRSGSTPSVRTSACRAAVCTLSSTKSLRNTASTPALRTTVGRAAVCTLTSAPSGRTSASRVAVCTLHSTPSVRTTAGRAAICTLSNPSVGTSLSVTMGASTSSPVTQNRDPVYVIPVKMNMEGAASRGHPMSTTVARSWQRTGQQGSVDSDGYSRLVFSKQQLQSHYNYKQQPMKTYTFAPVPPPKPTPCPPPPVKTLSMSSSLRNMSDLQSLETNFRHPKCQSAEDILAARGTPAVHHGTGTRGGRFCSNGPGQAITDFSSSSRSKVISRPTKKSVTFARQVELQATSPLPTGDTSQQEVLPLSCHQLETLGRCVPEKSARFNLVR